MNRRSLALITIALAANLLLGGCASTPHGVMFPATLPAPDLETGRGCEAYGVYRSGRLTQISTQVRFQPEFIQPWEVEEKCGRAGRAVVWGCYREDGQAFIVGRDWKVYWHEWCHAKLGGGHHSQERNATHTRINALYKVTRQH